MAKLIALSVNETWDYVLVSQRKDPADEQVVWTLAPLSALLRAEIVGGVQMQTGGDGTTVVMNNLLQRYKAVKAGLRSVKNLLDGEGALVVLDHEGGLAAPLKAESVSQLRDEWILELGTEIINRSSLGDSEEDVELVKE